MTEQFFNISFTIYTRLTRSMEKACPDKYLRKLFRQIRNQIAARAQFHDSPVCPQASRTWSRRKLCHLYPDRHKNLYNPNKQE